MKTAAAGRSLSEMLLADELEAIYSPPRPQAYHPQSGRIARLFPDFRRVGRSTSARPAPFLPST